MSVYEEVLNIQKKIGKITREGVVNIFLVSCERALIPEHNSLGFYVK